MRCALALAGLAIAGNAAAQVPDELPLGLSVPVPAFRPADFPPNLAPVVRDMSGPRVAVVDRPDPEDREVDDAAPADPPAQAPIRVQLRETDEEFAACKASLEELGVTYEEVDAIRHDTDRDCGIERPLKISTAAPGIELRPESPMRCATALALGQWTKQGILPAVDALPDAGKLVRINHASSYVCRRRNNRPTGKPSEHSFGNALDIVSFEFENAKPLPVEPRDADGPRAQFQRAVRTASCDHFTTVIGPGTDASHADHIHLDIIERRGGYRLCE